MKLLKTFIYSIKLPNKQAMFKLNRIGMDITVMFLMIMILIVTIPSMADQIISSDNSDMQMNIIFFLIYFFIFNYLPLAIIVFLAITLLAYIFTGIARLMRRQVRFPMLWKLTAYSTTHPFLLYTVLSLWYDLDELFNVLSICYIILLLIKILSIYPKRRIRRRN